MDLSRKWVVATLICLMAVVTLATGDRAAMVIETRGKVLWNDAGSDKQIRTLQVLPEGAVLRVGEQAVLRLSFFKSGRKETVTGPCTVRIEGNSSKMMAGSGSVEVQKGRNASTELDNSTNLRRTGGAMQASTGIVPENELAFYSNVEVAPQRVRSYPSQREEVSDDGGGVVKSGGSKSTGAVRTNVLLPPLRFTQMSYAYLTPEEASTVRWNQKGNVKLELYRVDGPVYAVTVQGNSTKIPLDYLEAGEVHRLVARGTRSATSQYFKIFSPQEVREYEQLVRELKASETGDPHSLYSELIYLNAQLGLLSRARATAQAAVKQFPGDDGFRAVLGELNNRLAGLTAK